MMAMTHTGLEVDENVVSKIIPISDEKSWNVTGFVSFIMEKTPSLDWTAVINMLDNPKFLVLDPQGAQLILNASKVAIEVKKRDGNVGRIGEVLQTSFLILITSVPLPFFVVL